MFDIKNIMRKKRKKSSLKLNYFDLSVIVMAVIVIAALLFFRSQKKERWVNLTMEVMREEWWWDGVDPFYWYVNDLQVGDQALNSLGVAIGEITDVQVFEVGGPRKKALISLRLKVTHDKTRDTFVFNYKPLEIGQPLNLTFGNNGVKGMVTGILGEDGSVSQMHDRVIWVLVQNLRPEYVSEYQPGLAMIDSLGREIVVVEDVIRVERAVREQFSDIRGRMVETRSVLLRDVVLQLRVKAYESRGTSYFPDGAVVKLGENVWIHFPEILAADAEIVKIIE